MSNKIITISDLGRDYQLDLFHELITDPKFGESVINILDPKHFNVIAYQKLMALIKDYYSKHESILNFPSLRSEVNMQTPDETLKAQLLDVISEIESREIVNANVQEHITKFCKMQSLRHVLQEISKKVERGQVEEYDQIEKKLKDALIFKDTEDPISVYHDVTNVLSENARDVMPTGINGIDEILGGGLGRGELALVIAPLGVGKTTYLTKVAHSAYASGRNVLHIFFEDKEKVIQQKHYALMAGMSVSDILKAENKEIVINRLNKFKERLGKRNDKEPFLLLRKLPADGSKITDIKNLIKKLQSRGQKIDLVIIDYVDCIALEKEHYQNDEWANEGKVMRMLETIIEETDVACWTATQGNRASTSVEVVRTENMGGSLKKAQIAHFIMSIGKTMEQKENAVATISILKNRLGRDGLIFQNCKFDNATLDIDTEDQLTEVGFETNKQIMRKEKQRKQYQEFVKAKHGEYEE